MNHVNEGTDCLTKNLLFFIYLLATKIQIQHNKRPATDYKNGRAQGNKQNSALGNRTSRLFSKCACRLDQMLVKTGCM